MGKFSQKKHEEANDALLNSVTDNNKFESVKELLTMLSGKSFDQLVNAVITTALGSEGAITTAISNAITAALGENGAIETWGDGRYTKKTE
jgi:uncharacterized protein (DUF697 family)